MNRTKLSHTSAVIFNTRRNLYNQPGRGTSTLWVSNMKNISRLILIGACCCGYATTAVAEWYWGAGVIQQENWAELESLAIDAPVPAGTFDNTDPGLKLYSGFKATENFSIELEYKDQMEFGVGDLFNGEELWLQDQSRTEISTKALLLSGQSTFSIDEGKYLFVRGGLYNWDIKTTDLKFTDDLYLNSQGTDVFYSVGANFDFTNSFGIRAEWERFAVDDEDVDFVSTELRFSF